MRIGIDISQLAFPNTGVANFVQNLVEQLVVQNNKNEYVLFYSSMRKKFQTSTFKFKSSNVHPRVQVKCFRFPPILLDLFWNKLHIFPIENFTGPIDIFVSSDWTQPPSKAKKVTILYDLIIYKYPEETHNQFTFNLKNFLIQPNIVASQKRRLYWVKKEVDKIICISKATKRDAIDILGIPEDRLLVVYPGV